MAAPYRGRVSARQAPRLSVREASAYVAEAFGFPIARTLRLGAGSDLTEKEHATFGRALFRSGVTRHVEAVSAAMWGDLPTLKAGEANRPARHGLREAVHGLKERIIDLYALPEPVEVWKVAAMLILLHGIDAHAHGALWKQEGTPPTGRARVRWIAKRLSRIDEGADVGQGAKRKARRGTSTKRRRR